MGNSESSADELHRSRRNTAPASARPRPKSVSFSTKNQVKSPSPPVSRYTRRSPPRRTTAGTPRSALSPRGRPQSSRSTAYSPRRRNSMSPPRYGGSRGRPGSTRGRPQSSRSTAYSPRRRNSMSPPRYGGNRGRPGSTRGRPQPKHLGPAPDVKYVEVKPPPRYMNTYDEYDEHGHRIKPRTPRGDRPPTSRPPVEPEREEVVYVRQQGSPHQDDEKAREARRLAAERVRQYKENTKPTPIERQQTVPTMRVTTAADTPRKPINYEMQKMAPKQHKKNVEMDYLMPNYVPSDQEDTDSDDDDDPPPQRRQQQSSQPPTPVSSGDAPPTPVDSGPPQTAPYDETSFSVPQTSPASTGNNVRPASSRGRDHRDPYHQRDHPPSDYAPVLDDSGFGDYDDHNNNNNKRPTTGKSNEAPQNGRWVRAKPRDFDKPRHPNEHPPLEWERNRDRHDREKVVDGRRLVSNSKKPPPKQWKHTADPISKKPQWHSDFLTDDYY